MPSASVDPYYLKSGERRWRVTYRKPDHKQTTKRGFRTKRDAEDWKARNVTIAINDGDYVDPNAGKTTIVTIGRTWLEGRRGSVKPKYWHDLECAWRVHVAPQWGNRSLADIRHSEVQAWIAALTGAGKSATVVIRAFGVLRAIYTTAIADGLVRRSPCDGTQLPRKVRKPRVYLTTSQVLELAEAAKTNGGAEGMKRRALVLLLGFCGLRWGEATALRASDVSPDTGRIQVARSVTRTRGGYVVGEPKTWERRTVPVPDYVMNAIMSQCAGRDPDALIFPATSGGFMAPPHSTERSWYRRALDLAGLPVLTAHDLRHTAASIAVSAGANVKAIQRMLGHKSAAMTLDTYADLFDSDLDAVAAEIGKSIIAAVTTI